MTGLIILLAALSGLLLLRWLLTRFLRSQMNRAKAAEAGTPADYDLNYREHWIELGNRKLQAWTIKAPEGRAPAPALLLFQGGDDVISEMGHLHRYLHDHGCSVMAFDYSGNGRSTGEPSTEAFHQDSLAVFERFESQFDGQPKYLWGFSAGCARLLSILPQVQHRVDGAFLVGPFASMRAVARERLPLFSPLDRLLIPDMANNVKALQEVDAAPVVIIHSRDDEMIPFHHAEKLQAAGRDNIELVPRAGLKHNDCWQPINDEYWQPVFDRINSEG